MVGQIVASHIEACRSRPGFRNALAIVIPESNLPSIPEGILRELKELRLDNLILMNEDGSDSKHGGIRVGYNGGKDLAGSRTTRLNKPRMVSNMIKTLSKSRVIFYKNFVVSQPDYTTVGDIKESIIRQFQDYCRKLHFTLNDPTKAAEIIYTGKLNNGKDDFPMAIMINLLMHQVFWSRAKYKKYWNQ